MLRVIHWNVFSFDRICRYVMRFTLAKCFWYVWQGICFFSILDRMLFDRFSFWQMVKTKHCSIWSCLIVRRRVKWQYNDWTVLVRVVEVDSQKVSIWGNWELLGRILLEAGRILSTLSNWGQLCEAFCRYIWEQCRFILGWAE